MPDSPLLQHPRNRFVAFSAVGVAMVCLPLWQVLRYQQSEMNQLAAQRALLDPVSQAVQVQFGLLAHRQVSGQLLQGQPQLEPARQAVQAGVDERLRQLGQELARGLWSNAAAEARDLSRDWLVLAQRVKARALNAAQSDEDHNLRLEQALQVLDLVSSADAVSDARHDIQGSGARLADAARLLSQLAAEMPYANAMVAKPAAGAEARLQATQLRLLRRLQALELALMKGPNKPPADSPLASALAAVDHSTRRVLQLQLDGSEGTSRDALQAQRNLALQQAHDAQLALFNLAQAQRKRMLAQRQGQLQQQQTVLLAAMAFLSAVALALAAGLVRQTRSAAQPQEPPPLGPGPEGGTAAWPDPAAQTAAPTHQKLETGRLLSRLRTARGGPGTPAEAAPQEAAGRQDTTPPSRP